MSTLSSNARYHSTYNHIRPIKGVLKWFRSIFHFCDFVNLALEALVDGPTPEVVDSNPFFFQFFFKSDQACRICIGFEVSENTVCQIGPR